MREAAMIPTDDPQSALGWAFAGLALIGAGIFKARTWLSHDKVARTGDAASVETIQMLRKMLRDLMQQREAWVQERQELIKSVDSLRDEVRKLREQIHQLRGQK